MKMEATSSSPINLKENAYDLNMKVADFKRTNMLLLSLNLKKMLPT